jgi:ABC-2 type transport system ATP-binding protein
MITINNLLKRYKAYTALDHIDLHVNTGVILGLLGPNGAGKTTLVSILNGLTDFEEGEIKIFGLSLKKEIKEIRKRSSFIPQSLALYENLTVKENLHFFAKIQNITGSTLHHNIDYAISTGRLQPMLDQLSGTLSGGQKRQLNIAIGLLNNPELLYFDEPTAGLDPELRNDILDTIYSLKNDGKTVIYTSHYMQEIEKICDEIAIIHHGRIIHRGSLETMLQDEHNDSILIELLHPNKKQLDAFSQQFDAVEVINGSTLVMHTRNGAQTGNLLTALETANIGVQHIHFGTTNLESIFIRLTSQASQDV